MKRDLIIWRMVKVMLIVLGMTAGQNVWADNGWKIEATTNGTTTTFTVSRTNTSVAETVKYRLVNLSAYAGQHYNVSKVNDQRSSELSGDLTFSAGDDSRTIQVTEKGASTDAFKYQNGTERSYKLEVTDAWGFFLADRTRSFTTGTRFTNSYVNKSITDLVYFQSGSVKSGSGNKYLDVAHSGTNGIEKMIDDDYDYNNNTLCTVSTDNLYDSDSDLRTWLKSLGYKMYATVYFQQREVDDGYQYIQILADNASTYDGKDGDGKIDNGPTTSLYKAAFILTKTEDHLDSWKYQAFPHKTDDHTSSTEFDYSDSYLYQQAFKSANPSYRATTSGSLVLNTTINDINVRFDANGGGNDTWYLKNLKVRLPLVDATAPIILSVNKIVVAGGIYAFGNTVYISVPFDEIVTVSGTPTLNTTWGTLGYDSGSGSNVLTFSGVISANEDTQLTVNSISGTVNDLAGNAYNTSTSINKNFSLTVVSPWAGSGTGNDPYIIRNTWQLDCLAKEVWGGYNGNQDGKEFTGKYFKLGTDITYSYLNEDTWDKTTGFTSNFKSIGGWGHSFQGTFDGDGHSISGIRIYKDGTTNEDQCQGLFGMISTGSMVKNLILYDANIVGYTQVGGITGSHLGGTIQDCYVYNTRTYGTDNNEPKQGIIRGSGNSTVTRAWYKDSMISSNTGQYNIAKLTLTNGTTVNRTQGTILNTNVTIYNDGVTLNGEEYYTQNADITLGYNGNEPEPGLFVKYIATDNSGTDITTYIIHDGNILTMSNTDVTVSTTFLPVVTYLDADGIAQQCSDYSFITGNYSEARFGALGKTHWYVVSSDATIDVRLIFRDATANLILCDGATLAVKNHGESAVSCNGSINIFGQTNGNGTLKVVASGAAGLSSQNLGIYGGIVRVEGTQGINTGLGSITLGYTAPANSIYASSYDCKSLIVKAGCTLTDGEGHLFSGTYTDDGLSAVLNALSSETLQPAYSLTLSSTDFTVTGGTVPQGYAPAGETVTLHTDEGYTITSAKYTPAGGSATDLTLEQDEWSFTMPAANTMVTATRVLNTYTVHFDANTTNGINATGTMADQTFTYSQAQNLTGNAFKRTGYTFTGWNTQADGTGTAYTDGQSVNNLTTVQNGVVTLYAQWSVIPWTGNGDSENDPYLIEYASQLVKLADDVNSGSWDYTGEYFKLNNDIDMDGVAFDGIGNEQYSFKGTFDGAGKTISHVTVNRAGENCVGVFGNVQNGTVKKLIIDGASVTGYAHVGVLVGTISVYVNDNYVAAIENCLVLNSSVSSGLGNHNVGIISGDSSGSSYVTFSTNYYRGCTLLGTANATNVGVGDFNDGTALGAHDVAGARSIHTLKLPEHVTVSSAETVIIGTTTYYASNVQVTLSHEQGYKLTDVKVNGVAATYNADDTWSFNMPAADAVVTGTISVPYIDADGNMAYCTNFTVIESSNSGVNLGTGSQDVWFVVSGNVTINGKLSFYYVTYNAHLILCDGATLTINNNENDSGVEIDGNLFIYGQTAGNGTASITSGNIGIGCYNLIINGGIVSSTSTFSTAIRSNFDITINRGSVTAHGYMQGIMGQNIIINGGTVNATKGEGYGSDGIYASQSISIGYTELTDRITASSYYAGGTVSVKEGQFITDGTYIYSRTLNSDQIAAIAGKTLKPCVTYIDADGSTKYCTDYTLIQSSNQEFNQYGIDGETNWYVVSGDVTIDGLLCFEDKLSHLIVCDGATLTVTYPLEAIYGNNGGITIYGQTLGSGTITASCSNTDGTGIRAFGPVTINGGTVNASGKSGISGTTVTINRGTINATGTWCGIGGSNVTINGGTVSATGNAEAGIFANNTITIGWTSATDRITASSYAIHHQYGEAICVKDLQTLTDGSAVYSDTLSSDQIAAIAGKTLWPSVTYIDENGEEQYCTDYTVIDGSQKEFFTDGWFVVNGNDVNISDVGINTNDYVANVNLILCDGATLTVGGGSGYISVGPNFSEGIGQLAIYGQSGGTGTINAGKIQLVHSGVNNIYINGGTLNAGLYLENYSVQDNQTNGITIRRGTVTATESNEAAIYINGGNLTITGGTVTASGTSKAGIYTNGGSITITGGNVQSTSTGGYGMEADECIILGWTSTTDRIKASSYICGDGTISVKDGQTIWNGSEALSGTLYESGNPTSGLTKLNGKTLQPYQASVTLTEADGVSNLTAAETVTFSRSFSAGKASTICLPFPMTGISGGKVYEFVDVTYNSTDGWVATMVDATPPDGNQVTSTEANKPYLFMPDGNGEVTFSGTVMDVPASVTAGTTSSGDNNEWTFHGTYSRLDYAAEKSDTNPFSGTVFGFAAKGGTAVGGESVTAGQFVKAASGAYILPFRAFLTYSGSNTALHAPGRDGATVGQDIPDRITVRLIGKDGTMTAVGTLDLNTGDVTIERWFDMSGRAIDGAPAAPGMYINNKGKKIMISEIEN